jgi:membrane associated rhomboid family serine protease
MCALVVGALVVPMAWDFDLTEWGHVLAVVIGLLWWPWLRRRGRLGMLGSLRDALRHGWRREWPEAVREPVSS